MTTTDDTQEVAERQPPANETHDWQETYARLNRQIEEARPPTLIIDDERPEFVGEFVGVRRAPSKYGLAPVCTFKELRSEEMYSIWLHHQVLRTAMIEARPKPGEMVMIRYLGREMSGSSGESYANYRIAVDRPAGASTLTWEELEEHPTVEHAAADAPLPAGWQEPPAGDTEDDIPF